MREPCPTAHTKGFIFGYAVAFTLIYPIGVPLLLFVIMHTHRVPEMARRKRERCLLEAMELAQAQDTGTVRAVAASNQDSNTATCASVTRPAPTHGKDMMSLEALRVLFHWRHAWEVENTPTRSAGISGTAAIHTPAPSSSSAPCEKDSGQHVGGNDSGVGEAEMRREVLRRALKMEEACVIKVAVCEWNVKGRFVGVEESGETQAVSRVGFLFVAYKVEFWWFELFELSRKLFLTSILSLISFGTTEQLAIACLVVLLIFLFTSHLSPYRKDHVNLLQSLCHMCILVTFFHGFWSRTTIEVQESSWTGTALITMNLLVFALPLYTFCLHDSQGLYFPSWLGRRSSDEHSTPAAGHRNGGTAPSQLSEQENHVSTSSPVLPPFDTLQIVPSLDTPPLVTGGSCLPDALSQGGAGTAVPGAAAVVLSRALGELTSAAQLGADCAGNQDAVHPEQGRHETMEMDTLDLRDLRWA
eukprot:CAMPEP_0206220102 /NCGR_PEP_ID=MMETSP0047_2-20121206/4701_1 /ASSEMBLY_ACC=CAM_ASM_000192 /TAXON_ID=195065 /ORGANISM="Chroomonas mesostigmatica_cf, Strain CCMP1168" /LENGTH=471 /DNA_ID=CAMNT_0053642745 /DNA_START=45 /DNA_END=1460 /DNA_ORIENTATION=-